MNYIEHYNRLIERAKKRKVGKGVYTEEHHIVPKCLGGTNYLSNIVKLTAREHFIAHWLLHRADPNNSKLSFAFKMMSTVSTSKQFRYTPSSRAVAEAIEAGKLATSNLMKGVKKSSTHVKKVSHANTGKRRSEEVKSKLSLLKKGKPNGKAKGVFQLDLEGSIIRWFRTTEEAMLETGVHSTNIQQACRGVYSQSGGYKWKYGQEERGNYRAKVEVVKIMIEKLDEASLELVSVFINQLNGKS